MPGGPLHRQSRKRGQAFPHILAGRGHASEERTGQLFANGQGPRHDAEASCQKVTGDGEGLAGQAGAVLLRKLAD
jgi:hypothetical protein